MAWVIPLSESGTGIAEILSSGTSLYVAQGVTLASTGSDAVSIAGPGQQIHVHGTVAGHFSALFGGSGQVATTVVVGATGRLVGFEDAAVLLTGGGDTIRNAGVIEHLGTRSAMTLCADSTTLVNDGLIVSSSKGITTTNGSGTMFIENNGRIETPQGFSAFVDLTAFGSTDTIVNRGLIQGSVVLGSGHDLFDGRSGTLRGELLGGEGHDRLWTGEGSNSLFGGAGADELRGGAGADRLDGGASADRASYAGAGAGVTANLANASANTGDAKGDVYVSIEWLVGSSHADTLIGNGGANRLIGGSGADTLTGGGGADEFVFVTAPGGTATADRITDFATDVDEIRLERSVFAGLAAGELAAGAFKANASGLATDSSDRVIYETDTGSLRFDADGQGGTATARVFGRLGTGLNLGADDFLVF